MTTAPRVARLLRFGGAGVGAGLLLTASLPPLGWWPLAPAGVAVLHLVIARAAGVWRPKLAVAAGAGLGLYGPGLWWVTEFHAVGWIALVALEASILALALVAATGRRLGAGLPAALVLAEALRGRWPFGGLPLAGLDLGQVGGPLLPVVRLGGRLLLVAAVGLAGVGLAELVRRRPAGAAYLAGVALLASVGWLAFDGTPQGAVQAAAVQGGGPRGVRAVAADPEVVFRAHLAATAQVPMGTDLVLWPEDVVDLDGPLAGSAEEADIAGLARRLGATLVVGVTEDVAGRPGEAGRFRNAAVAWAPDGTLTDRYEKVRRVPFGEYVPGRPLFERLADLSNVAQDAIPGRGPGVLDTPQGRLGVLISYEVFFAERARVATSAGGRILLVPTNASSYTTSQVPSQELAAARLRAVETGRWVLQAAPTGYSAVVDQRGRVRARGPLGDRAVVPDTVGLRSGRTLATVLGDWPVILAAVGLAAGAWLKEPES